MKAVKWQVKWWSKGPFISRLKGPSATFSNKKNEENVFGKQKYVMFTQ